MCVSGVGKFIFQKLEFGGGFFFVFEGGDSRCEVFHSSLKQEFCGY